MALPSPPPATTGESLVLGDVAAHRLIEHAGFLPGDVSATFLAFDLIGKLPEDTALRRYIAPQVFVWHSEEGRAAHEALDRLSGQIAAALGARHPPAAGLRDALRFAILDRFLFTWLLATNVEKLLANRKFERIEVITPNQTLFQLVRTIGARLAPDVPVTPRWIGAPPVLAGPFRTLWPALNRVGVTALRVAKGDFSALGSPSRRLAKLLPAGLEGSRPAVIGWIARDRNYREGLRRVLAATLPLRPVFLILDADDDENTAEITKFAAGINRPEGHWLHILRYSKLHQQAQLDLGSAGIDGVVKDFAETLPASAALEREFARDILATELVDYPHLKTVCLIGRVIEALLAKATPAYAILCSARNASFAAVSEMLAAKGIASMDVNTYLVGNHARQVAPPTRYFGVIDDQQEALIMDFWGARREDILRIGYIWRDAGAAASGGNALAKRDLRSVLICTQPGETRMVEAFFQDIMAIIAGDERITAILKPHPAEPATTLQAYDAAIAAHGLENRVKRLEISVPVSSLFAEADLVITRTSNVGIEAALAGRPTIRYIAYDRYDPGVISNVVYAANVLTREQLQPTLHDLLFSESAFAALRALQQAYCRENPAQGQADGAGRIVAFLEAKVHNASGVEGEMTSKESIR